MYILYVHTSIHQLTSDKLTGLLMSSICNEMFASAKETIQQYDDIVHMTSLWDYTHIYTVQLNYCIIHTQHNMYVHTLCCHIHV